MAGLGEIGLPLHRLISKSVVTAGFDINPKLVNSKKLKKLEDIPTELLHICIPYNTKFNNSVIELVEKFEPQGIVIHSTIQPHTTEQLQKKLAVPVIYSAIRGVHKRMIKDLKRYTKFYSLYEWAPNAKWATKTFENRMKKAGIKSRKMSSPLVLELAKILVDTSYYGWLITYAQLTNMIAKQNKIDYDEMWLFADEIHKYLGNRPKMYPGFIGGHCVIENLDLINNETLNMIDEINNLHASKVKDAKSTAKKHQKTKII